LARHRRRLQSRNPGRCVDGAPPAAPAASPRGMARGSHPGLRRSASSVSARLRGLGCIQTCRQGKSAPTRRRSHGRFQHAATALLRRTIPPSGHR
jgi:hypothetical protein